MSAIETYLQYIASKVWARDVRTAIVNAIRQCYDDVHNPTLNTEALQAAIQAKIDAGQMAALTIGDRTITAAKLALGVIPTPDATLSQSGVPADAKKTGDEISALQADLGAVSDGIKTEVPTVLKANAWEQGYWGYGSGSASSSSYYIRTGNMDANYGKGGFYVDIPDGYTFRALYYNGNTYANVYTDLISGPSRYEVSAPKAVNVRFVLKKTESAELPPEEAPDITINRIVYENADDTVNVERTLPLSGNPLINGTYDGTGAIVERESRLRTRSFIKVCAGEKVVFTAGTKAAQILIGMFSKSKTYLKEVGCKDDGAVIEVDQDGYIIPVYRTSAEQPAITVADYDAVTKIIPAWKTANTDTNELLYSMLTPKGEVLDADKWESGYWTYGNGTAGASSNYIRTGNLDANYGKGGFYIDVPTGYDIRVLFYNGNSYANIYTDSISGPERIEFRTPKAQHIRLSLRKTGSGAITPGEAPIVTINRYAPSGGYPELSSTQKSQLLDLVDDYFENRASIVYDFDRTINSLPYKSLMFDANNKVHLNCGMFVQMIWSGVDFQTFASPSTYDGTVIKAFDWGYFHPFYANRCVGRLAERDGNGNVTKLYGLTNAPSPKYPTTEKTYSWTSLYDSAETGGSSRIYAMDNGELVDTHQKWKSFLTVANMAAELQQLGYEIPISQADVGDLVFYEQLPYDMDARYNIRFRRIGHVAIVIGRVNGFIEIAEVSYYHGTVDPTLRYPLMKHSIFSTDDFLAAKSAHGIERIVMCARHPAAYGATSNVPNKFTYADDRGNG